ncbi:MAG: hypothetical protein ABIG39_06495 [Candidatus Micrarchaeota archaeon]
MRRATIASVFVLLVSLAFAGFQVTPEEDGFDMLQNSSVTRTYVITSNDTSGIVDVSTSVSWVEATTDYLNVSPWGQYTAKITFSPGMMAPDNYKVVITFSGDADIFSVRASIDVVKTKWLYGYLYDNESYDGISYKNITNAGGNYSLVSINGVESFLIKNDEEIVDDIGEIRKVYDDYYMETLYPTESELQEINDLVESFNNSRNALTQYGPAEYTCKQYTGMNDNLCYDSRSCELACSALVELCGPAMGALGGPFVSALVEFGTLTTAIDDHYESVLGNMSDLDHSNIGINLEDAKNEVSSMKSAAIALKNNKLRYDLSCMECYGMCPQMMYNATALEEAESKLNALSSRIQPILEIDARSDSLLQNTVFRIFEINRGHQKLKYMKRYDSMKSLAGELEERVSEVMTHVDNQELDDMFSEFLNASAGIELIIDSGDYSDLTLLDMEFDSAVDRFYSLKGEMDALVETSSRIYGEVKDIRDNATYYLMKAEMNVHVGDRTILKLEELRNRMTELDANFTTPMRINESDALEAGYYGVTYEAKGIAESKPSSSIVGRIVSKIVRTEKAAVLSTIGFFKPLSLSEKTEISEYVTLVAAGVGDMLMALFMIIFLGAFVIRNRRVLKKKRQHLVLFSLFCAATLMVAIICTAMFYYVTATYGGERTLNLFIFEVERMDGVAVVVDHATASLSDNPESTKGIMTSCGEEVAEALSQYGTQTYLINNNTCTVGALEMNYSDCEAEFESIPIIYVRHGDENIISFRTLYAVNATIEGTDGYIAECSLGKVLR